MTDYVVQPVEPSASGEIQHFTARPPVVEAIQWTGSNFASIDTAVTAWGNGRQVIDNGDGTLLFITPANGYSVNNGDWISNGLAEPISDTNLHLQFQRLPGEGPFGHLLIDPQS